MSESFQACFACKNTFNLSQNALGSEDKNVVFASSGFEVDWFLRVQAMRAGD